MDDVLLFSKVTTFGTFEVRTPSSTFEITLQTFGSRYFLYVSSAPGFVRDYDTPYKAIAAVGEHRIGLRQWDESSETVSDYAPDWTPHLDKKFKIQLIGNFIDQRPDCSYRQLIDYFRLKHSYVAERMEIAGLLQELIITGQMKRPLKDWGTPCELKRLVRIAKVWLADQDEQESSGDE